ncbi:MAG: DUF1573 domain-containing protein [Flavobacteriales bacterium]|nr:DUF1573 domain-containing protein [Flavobacteriales bacterium]
MKRIAIIASCIALVTLSACNNEKAAETKTEGVSTELINNPSTAEEGVIIDPEEAAKFEFEETVIEFGEISQGEKVKRIFKFTNIGKSNLIISDAKGSCGCTVPLWPRNPIAPGESGEIEVVFDSNGKSGRQNKTVTLVANTVPNTMVLAIKGDVLAPEAPVTPETPAL